MKKHFNHILDIDSKDKVFPIDKNSYALFFTRDRRFFIYALYTKKDLSSPELIEIDFNSYMDLRSSETIENFVENIDDLGVILLKMKREAIADNLSVGEILKLDEK